MRSIGVDRVFAALANPTRRAMLDLLTADGASITELTEFFPMTRPAVTKHLMILHRAGLVRRGPGSRPRWSLEPDSVAGALDWLTQLRGGSLVR